MAWKSLTADPQPPPRDGDDHAVSPVVGMILVLGVTVVGVVAVLYWGVPTVANMKSDAEFQSVQNQFQDLDANVDDLTRGTPGETAKRWQPAFERGGITFDEDDERWILATDLASDEDWGLADVYDTDNNITLANLPKGTDHTVTVDAWTVDTGVETPITVSDADDCSSTSDTDDMDPVTIDDGDDRYLCLYDTGGSRFFVDGETVKLEVVDDATGDKLARLYILDMGTLRYIMTMGPSQRDAYHTNGAVIAGHIDDESQIHLDVKTDPPFGPPRDVGGETRFFGRLVDFQGQGAVSGSDATRFSLLMSLYSTDLLEDSEDVHSLKVWIDGRTSEAWYDYYTTDGTDYRFETRDPAGAPEFIEDRPSSSTFDLKILLSVVELKVT